MKRKFFLYICVLIIATIFTYAFSASYSSHSIDKLAYVIALGIDSSENDNLKVTFQFTKSSTISDQGSSEEDLTIENTVEASSIENAINLMNAYMGKPLSLSHCKIIVFSEEIARNDISTQIYSLINNEEIRPTANIVVSKCSAKDYISNSKPILDKLSTRYYETFFVSSNFTGFTADLTIGDFYNKLVCTTCNPVTILGNIEEDSSEGNESSQNKDSESSSSSSSEESSSEKDTTNTTPNTQAATDDSNKNSSSENNSNITADKNSISGQKTSKNFGTAVFKQGRLVGELSTLENISHLLVDNNIGSFIVTVKNPTSNNSYIDISLSQYKDTKVNVDIHSGAPYISVEVFVSGKILTLDENSNYTEESTLNAVKESVSSYLEDTISSYLYKTSKDFESDIDSFGKKALKYFLTYQDWLDFNWSSKYKDTFFDVTVNTNIESSMLLTNS